MQERAPACGVCGADGLAAGWGLTPPLSPLSCCIPNLTTFARTFPRRLRKGPPAPILAFCSRGSSLGEEPEQGQAEQHFWLCILKKIKSNEINHQDCHTVSSAIQFVAFSGHLKDLFMAFKTEH